MAVTTQAAMMRHRTVPSPSTRVASQRSLRLYRDCLRSIPLIREKYQVDFPKKQITARFREEWERNRAVKDSRLIDMLVFKGNAELDEAKFLWKQRPHIMAFLTSTHHHQHHSLQTPPNLPNGQPSMRLGGDFLKRFFAGQEIDY